MKTTEQIRCEVDSMIRQEELPARANLKVLKAVNCAYEGITDPVTEEWLLEPMDEDEIEAYREHLKWFMMKDYGIIMSLPMPEEEDFKMPIEKDDSLSFAFDSMDFQRAYPFNKYHYKLKKVYERVKDLATTYAVLTDSDAKERIHERFKDLVNAEFRNRAIMIVTTYKKYGAWMNKDKVLDKVEELNEKIRKCKRIWKQHAYEP